MLRLRKRALAEAKFRFSEIKKRIPDISQRMWTGLFVRGMVWRLLRSPYLGGNLVAEKGFEAGYWLASIFLPFLSCSGRELIRYNAANARSCARLMLTGCSKTNQRTPSVQGGAVSEPTYVQ